MSDLPVLDQKSIDELAAAGADFLAEVLELLVESGGEQLREMRMFLEARDSAALGGVAHSLKGAAAGAGAAELAAACAQLENACRNGESASLRDLLGDVSASFDRLRAAVTKLIS